MSNGSDTEASCTLSVAQFHQRLSRGPEGFTYNGIRASVSTGGLAQEQCDGTGFSEDSTPVVKDVNPLHCVQPLVLMCYEVTLGLYGQVWSWTLSPVGLGVQLLAQNVSKLGSRLKCEQVRVTFQSCVGCPRGSPFWVLFWVLLNKRT